MDDTTARRSDLSLRPLEETDFPELLELMRLTWYAEMDPSEGSVSAADELLSYLGQTTYSCVAARRGEGGEELLGCVLARHGTVPDDACLCWKTYQYALKSHNGASKSELASIYQEEMAARVSMLDEVGMADDDTVLLLVVSPASKGLGLGRRLLAAATKYLRDNGAATLHLVTDTTCDWGFYEHLGLRRLAERANEGPSDPWFPDAFYLYGMTI